MMHESPLSRNDRHPGGFTGRLRLVLRSRGFSRTLVILAGSLLCLMVFILTVTPKRYSLSVGMVPNQTIAASKDVVDELTTLKNRETAAASVTPVYHYREGVTEEVLANLEAVYSPSPCPITVLPAYTARRSMPTRMRS